MKTQLCVTKCLLFRLAFFWVGARQRFCVSEDLVEGLGSWIQVQKRSAFLRLRSAYGVLDSNDSLTKARSLAEQFANRAFSVQLQTQPETAHVVQFKADVIGPWVWRCWRRLFLRWEYCRKFRKASSLGLCQFIESGTRSQLQVQ